MTLSLAARRGRAFGSGLGKFGSYGKVPGPNSTPIGWRVPFSEPARVGGKVAHFLVDAANYEGLAYRVCDPGLVVNPALAKAEVGRRCAYCSALLAKHPAIAEAR